uniref:T-complex protein 1 subunit eta n=1 Tax=Percolomonas cosmopolitus TaxID=63605 RepID=A0A7S1KQY8_9EUKA
MLQPSIILLRDGTDTSQGTPQLVSNIDACLAIVDLIRTTLGPMGMDKLIVNSSKRATISNDGATIVKLLEIEHPAARSLADIARSQDDEIGDGTTTVMILAGEFMRCSKRFVEDGVHPQIIIRAFRQASQLALKRLAELQVNISKDNSSQEDYRAMLVKCAGTALNSKLIGGMFKNFFAEMVVDAVLSLDEDLDIDLVGVKKVHGGAMEESFLVKGVAFKKTFSYAGFEQQPKLIVNPKIILLNIELELKAEKENAEIKIEDPDQYQSIVDAEWKIIYDKLDAIVKSGANVVLSKLAIGDLATQYFADRGIFCAGRVPEGDMRRVAMATGSTLQTTVTNVIPEVLGNCERFEERQVGNERYNLFTGCPQAKTATMILRGGGEQFIAESERSIHDAVMVVRRTVKNHRIVAGGGAIEMELSAYLRNFSRTIKGKEQLIINAYAKALEIIPRQLSENAGFDSIDILNKLRQKHATEGGQWWGVDVNEEGITDTMETHVWEPSMIKRNAISSATDAACLILSIDETVKNPQSDAPSKDDAARARQAMGMAPRFKGQGGR